MSNLKSGVYDFGAKAVDVYDNNSAMAFIFGADDWEYIAPDTTSLIRWLKENRDMSCKLFSRDVAKSIADYLLYGDSTTRVPQPASVVIPSNISLGSYFLDKSENKVALISEIVVGVRRISIIGEYVGLKYSTSRCEDIRCTHDIESDDWEYIAKDAECLVKWLREDKDRLSMLSNCEYITEIFNHLLFEETGVDHNKP